MAARKNYPGSIEKRGDAYRVRLCVGGERSYHTLKDVTRSEAEQFARDKYRELQKRADRMSMGLPGSVAFSELLEQFEEEHLPGVAPKTRKSYRDSLKPLKAYFVKELEDPELRRIRPGHVRGYLKWRRVHGPKGQKRKKPLSNRTLQRDRAVLHKAFEIALSVEYVDANPVSAVDAPKPETRDPVILTDEQYEKLLEQCEDDTLRLYVLTMAETGARSESECLWIRWEDIDFEEGFLWIDSSKDGHRTKSGKGRWVPLTPRLKAALREHAAKYRLQVYNGSRSPWVFHHTRGWRNTKPGDRIGSLRRSFARAAEDAKLPAGLTQHDLRHRRVTKWLAEERNPVHVKEAVGHSDLRTTMGYTHLAREHLRSLVNERGARSGRETGS